MKRFVFFITLFAFILSGCAKKPHQVSALTTQSLPPVQSSASSYQVKMQLPFDCRSVVLSKEALGELNQKVNTLGPSSTIILQAVTPASGSENLNIAQSYLRAKAVADWLALKGFNLSLIKLNALGGTYATPANPISACQVIVLS